MLTTVSSGAQRSGWEDGGRGVRRPESITAIRQGRWGVRRSESINFITFSPTELSCGRENTMLTTVSSGAQRSYWEDVGYAGPSQSRRSDREGGGYAGPSQSTSSPSLLLNCPVVERIQCLLQLVMEHAIRLGRWGEGGTQARVYQLHHLLSYRTVLW